MSEQQCFQDVAGKIIDVDAKRSQLLSWLDSLAGALGKSFVFDRYYLFLASLVTDPEQVVYANYSEGSSIHILAFFEDSLIEFFLRNYAFAYPFSEKGLSPFFVEILKQKVVEVVKLYRAKVKKNYRYFLYVPSIEKWVPVPPELEDKLAQFIPNWNLEDFPNFKFYLTGGATLPPNEMLVIYTPFPQSFGTKIKIYIKNVYLEEPISANIPVFIEKARTLERCGVIYINVLELVTGSTKLSEQCSIITKQDEPLANQTLCEALNKLVGYTEYALDILKKLTLKGATTLTTLLLY
jgi:hypothetical protein